MERKLDFARRLAGDEAAEFRADASQAQVWAENRLGCPVSEFRGLWSRHDDRPFEIAGRRMRLVRSACFSCNSNCEVLVFVDCESGQVARVEGDPESPVTKGVLCPKGLASPDLVSSPHRVRTPLVRVGPRGSGKWREVSWDEALDLVARRLTECKDRYGPEGVSFMLGTRRGWSREYSRLANVFGAVNSGTPGWAQCLWPRLVDGKVTFGGAVMESPDYAHTACILVWGTNPPATWPVRAADIMDARARGARLIVVDPVFSETASKAHIWLQLRPGTDTMLALGMLNVIVSRGLYDGEFVEKWTTGFDRLREHLAGYTLDKVADVTGVSADLIEKAASVYATTRPACVSRCVAIEQTSDPVQACRALSLLAAITGNIDVRGGNVFPSSRGDRSRNTHRHIMIDAVPEDLRKKRCGHDKYLLLCGDLSPVPSAHMPSVFEAMITGEPNPIKAALIFGSNALVSYANSTRVADALSRLEFIAVADLFLTPTAGIADVVLPASSWLERNNIISSFQCSPEYTIAQQKASEIGLPGSGPRSDVEIVLDLARRLGLEDRFWPSEDAMFEYLLEPTGLTFKQLCEVHRLHSPIRYRKFEEKGFDTPSGKVEIYSSLLEKEGVQPLPVYTEPFESPLRRDADGRSLAGDYPLILTTGGRVSAYRHTEYRQIPLLREIAPEPLMWVHPGTAAALGIAQGNEVVVETPTGQCRAFAELSEGIKPGVVQLTPGWWGEYNVNLAVPNSPCAEGTGTTPLRGLLCRVRRADTPALGRVAPAGISTGVGRKGGER
ncbi:MAG: molybdopterin-dependent oxidoreductase [Firmicutes bacterium]|nr:molybdopterin-dependent oxidoreductase [Bacillota bacterium]